MRAGGPAGIGRRHRAAECLDTALYAPGPRAVSPRSRLRRGLHAMGCAAWLGGMPDDGHLLRLIAGPDGSGVYQVMSRSARRSTSRSASGRITRQDTSATYATLIVTRAANTIVETSTSTTTMTARPKIRNGAASTT